MTLCPNEFVDFAHGLADAGGEVLRRYFRKSERISYKDDGTPVTLADVEAEEVLRDLISERYPSHGILGEELQAVHLGAEFVWVLDPIDGTDTFLSGVPLFGMLVALAWQRHFVLGVIDQPILRERWVGADGHGTSFNGKRVTTRGCRSLSEAVLHTCGPAQQEVVADAYISRLRRKCRQVHYGVECYTFGMLALGYVDLIVDYGYENYDFGSLEPVVRNAGGALTDWRGERLRLDSEGTILAVGDGKLLSELCSHLE